MVVQKCVFFPGKFSMYDIKLINNVVYVCRLRMISCLNPTGILSSTSLTITHGMKCAECVLFINGLRHTVSRICQLILLRRLTHLWSISLKFSVIWGIMQIFFTYCASEYLLFLVWHFEFRAMVKKLKLI